MGTITINIDDKTEKKFRDTAKERIGEGKGKLGKAVSEALTDWINNYDSKIIAKRQLMLMEKGFNMDYKRLSREEIHERK